MRGGRCKWTGLDRHWQTCCNRGARLACKLGGTCCSIHAATFLSPCLGRCLPSRTRLRTSSCSTPSTTPAPSTVRTLWSVRCRAAACFVRLGGKLHYTSLHTMVVPAGTRKGMAAKPSSLSRPAELPLSGRRSGSAHATSFQPQATQQKTGRRPAFHSDSPEHLQRASCLYCVLCRLQGGQPQLAGGTGGGARHRCHGPAAVRQV